MPAAPSKQRHWGWGGWGGALNCLLHQYQKQMCVCLCVSFLGAWAVCLREWVREGLRRRSKMISDINRVHSLFGVSVPLHCSTAVCSQTLQHDCADYSSLTLRHDCAEYSSPTSTSQVLCHVMLFTTTDTVGPHDNHGRLVQTVGKGQQMVTMPGRYAAAPEP